MYSLQRIEKVLREGADDGIVVVSGRVTSIVPSRTTLERPMTDREHEELLATATDRFERRLSEEIGALRVTMIEQDSTTRQEIAKEISGLRVEMSEQGSAIRAEMSAMRIGLSAEDAATRVEMSAQDNATRLEIAKLRLDMSAGFADTRVMIEARHRELLKWALVFWVGQAAAVAGIVSAFA